MQILYVSNFDPEINAGASGSIYGVTSALARKGHDVDIIWRDKREPIFMNQALFEAFELPWRQYGQVKEAFDRKRYDLVSISQPFGYLVYERLKPRHPEAIFLNRTHGWEDRVYANRGRWSEKLSGAASLLSTARQAFTHQACRRSLRACDGLVTPGSKCAKYVLENYSIPKEKVSVIPHGLYSNFFDQPLPERKLSGPAKLLYVGNYLPIKGSKVLEAVLPKIARRFPDVTIGFVVGAPHMEQVKKIYGPLFGERLEVYPWTERKNLVSVYGSHDIFLFSSLFEGFGKTFLEAMACGACVVGFEEGGLPDLAVNGREAFFCPPGDLEGYEKLLIAVIEDRELRSRVARSGKELARQYTWDRCVDRLESFYTFLREQKGVRS